MYLESAPMEYFVVIYQYRCSWEVKLHKLRNGVVPNHRQRLSTGGSRLSKSGLSKKWDNSSCDNPAQTTTDVIFTVVWLLYLQGCSDQFAVRRLDETWATVEAQRTRDKVWH